MRLGELVRAGGDAHYRGAVLGVGDDERRAGEEAHAEVDEELRGLRDDAGGGDAVVVRGRGHGLAYDGAGGGGGAFEGDEEVGGGGVEEDVGGGAEGTDWWGGSVEWVVSLVVITGRSLDAEGRVKVRYCKDVNRKKT
jgi:hypothetical protein